MQCKLFWKQVHYTGKLNSNSNNFFHFFAAILVLYFRYVFLFSENAATQAFHIFATACHFTPVFSAILVTDPSLLNQFWPTVGISGVYGTGIIVLALSAVDGTRWVLTIPQFTLCNSPFSLSSAGWPTSAWPWSPWARIPAAAASSPACRRPLTGKCVKKKLCSAQVLFIAVNHLIILSTSYQRSISIHFEGK